jgi:hypothetical protein
MVMVPLDVIALVGTLRYRELRSIPQIHEDLLRRGLRIAQRWVTDQLSRDARTGVVASG